MADPRIKSFEQYLGEAIATFLSESNINDLSKTSIMLSFFRAHALSVARANGDIIQVLRDDSVDRATGETLLRYAFDENVKIANARAATDVVTIKDLSFQKISTKIYSGSAAPNANTSVLKIADASKFPSTGQIYIGRGTLNIEGPIDYTNPQQVGGYWTIDLTTPTTRFHNTSESVILAQGGNRTITQGVVVKAPSSGGSPDVTFAVQTDVLLQDGEDTLAGVPVVCQQVGKIGNVPRGAIRTFNVLPFANASVINETAFSNGRDQESEESLKSRIKLARLSRGLGVESAIKSAVQGAQAPDEAAIANSVQVVRNPSKTTVYVDDGSGYERKTKGVGLEVIVDSALGGESEFSLARDGRTTGITKAFLLSGNSQPFDLSAGDRLAVLVGGVLYEHTFQSTDFRAEGSASAYEVVSSINANSLLGFSAATSENGQKITISSKEETDAFIQVASPSFGNDANNTLGFPLNEIDTLRLFKNGSPLYKDGKVASVFSTSQSSWSPLITTGATLILQIDGTSPITYTFTHQDFVNEGTFFTVSPLNSLQSWVNVLNAKLTGATARIVGQSIEILSNLGKSDRASISIDLSSSLVADGMFSLDRGLSGSGLASDYELSRYTGQIKLAIPLQEGDRLTAGIDDSEAVIYSADIFGGTVTIPNDAYLWVIADESTSEIIPTGVVDGTLLSVSKPFGGIVNYTSSVANAFADVQEGDYVIVSSSELSPSNRLEGRVYNKTSDTLRLGITNAEHAAVVVESNVSFSRGFTVVRTKEVPQKLKIDAGTYNIYDLASSLTEQAIGFSFGAQDDQLFLLKTLNLNDSVGSVMVVDFDENADALALERGVYDVTKIGSTAYIQTGDALMSLPAFVHGLVLYDEYADTPNSFISSIESVESMDFDQNHIVGFKHPFVDFDSQPADRQFARISSISGSVASVRDNPKLRRLRGTVDRIYFVQPLNFGAQDTMVVVMDGDLSDKTFLIPMYRRIETNTNSPLSASSFEAYDKDADLGALSDSFGSDFSFDDYKAEMKAKRVLNPSGDENAILYRSAQWGAGGEKIKVGYFYPTQPNKDIESTVNVDENMDISIFLKSGPSISTAIDGTTEWNVTVTSNTPVAGVDQVTYTWTGTGTAPNLVALNGGEYVSISSVSDFSSENTGTFKLSTEVGFLPTATSFTVQRPNGDAVIESNISTLVPGAISFYETLDTTAQEVADYVNSNLNDIMTATIVDDNGQTGAGTIAFSTYEDSLFVYPSVSLLDGINWILSTDLTNSPQFTFKQNLSYPSDTGYSFNDGEEIRLIPTDMLQVANFINTLAVSGISTSGVVKSVKNNQILQIASSTLGSSGSVHVVGGAGSFINGQVTDAPLVVADRNRTRVTVDKSSASQLEGEQWLRFAASNFQAKIAGINPTTEVSLIPNLPTAGKTSVKLENRRDKDLFFGYPRVSPRTGGRSWRIEKQGNLAVLVYEGLVGSSPLFSRSANLNDSSGGTISFYKTNSSEVKILVTSGNMVFSELTIGDRISIANTIHANNSGNFEISGVSDSGKELTIINTKAVTSTVSATITLTDNANLTGDAFSVAGVSKTEGVDWNTGASLADSAVNLSVALNTIPGVSATPSGATVLVEMTSGSGVIDIEYDDQGTSAATLSSAILLGESFGSGDFSATIGVREGDSMIVKGPFLSLNQGTFRVVRAYKNSVYYENTNAIEESQVSFLPEVDLTYDASTEFEVDSSNGKMKLSWTGVGANPSLGLARPGNLLSCDSAFDTDNQGQFLVSEVLLAEAEITDISCQSTASVVTGAYGLLYSAEDNAEYYFWENVNGGGGDPLLVGKIGIEVAVTNSLTPAQHAQALANAINAVSDFSAVAIGSKVRVVNAATGPATSASNISISGLSVEIYQEGRYDSVVAINPSAVSETTSGSSSLKIYTQDILFYPYEASIPGDKVYLSGAVLDSNNDGKHQISEILGPKQVIVEGDLDPVDFTLLANEFDGVVVEEGFKYTGYKKIHYVAPIQGNLDDSHLVLSSREVAEKITSSGGVSFSSIGKLNFTDKVQKGQDGYSYDTGLLAEVNRIVHGDPRDTFSYAGVGAAGVDILIDPPLQRRVQIGIVVRIRTGIPFIQVVEQVRNSVSALIDAQPIGESIAISSIVSVVNEIPGVFAVSISSPLYDPTNDVIAIAQNEKPLVIDPVTDITVSEN